MKEKTIEVLKEMYISGNFVNLVGAEKLAIELGIVTEEEINDLENKWSLYMA